MPFTGYAGTKFPITWCGKINLCSVEYTLYDAIKEEEGEILNSVQVIL